MLDKNIDVHETSKPRGLSFVQSELPRNPWNQTSDVHRGSTLITRVITGRCRYIT